MARTAHRPPSPVKIHAIKLSDADVDRMRRLGRDASDYIGRAVSGAAIVRALLKVADEAGAGWARRELFPHIESELAAGIRWGAVRKGGKKQ